MGFKDYATRLIEKSLGRKVIYNNTATYG